MSWRIELGTRGQAGKERRFADGEILRAFSEQIARSLFDPVAAVSEINVIQIELEDLIFADLLFELSREERLANFSAVGSLRIEETCSSRLVA